MLRSSSTKAIVGMSLLSEYGRMTETADYDWQSSNAPDVGLRTQSTSNASWAEV